MTKYAQLSHNEGELQQLKLWTKTYGVPSSSRYWTWRCLPLPYPKFFPSCKMLGMKMYPRPFNTAREVSH